MTRCVEALCEALGFYKSHRGSSWIFWLVWVEAAGFDALLPNRIPVRDGFEDPHYGEMENWSINSSLKTSRWRKTDSPPFLLS